MPIGIAKKKYGQKKVVLVFGKEALVSWKHLNTVLFYNKNAFWNKNISFYNKRWVHLLFFLINIRPLTQF